MNSLITIPQSIVLTITPQGHHLNVCLSLSLFIYIYIYIDVCVCVCVCVCVWIGLVWFYNISRIVSYFMSNPRNKYILNIYDLVWFGIKFWTAVLKIETYQQRLDNEFWLADGDSNWKTVKNEHGIEKTKGVSWLKNAAR